MWKIRDVKFCADCRKETQEGYVLKMLYDFIKKFEF